MTAEGGSPECGRGLPERERPFDSDRAAAIGRRDTVGRCRPSSGQPGFRSGRDLARPCRSPVGGSVIRPRSPSRGPRPAPWSTVTRCSRRSAACVPRSITGYGLAHELVPAPPRTPPPARGVGASRPDTPFRLEPTAHRIDTPDTTERRQRRASGSSAANRARASEAHRGSHPRVGAAAGRLLHGSRGGPLRGHP
jgi:hypothetical protein